VSKVAITVIVLVRGRKEAPASSRETPEQAATRLVQEYGLAERAAEFVYGRLQDHPEGDSRHEPWREVMAIVQKTRQRKMERRHLLR
jgi:hypothetical protein